ncbi:unnamed protein product, partial [Mesorhabditis belari]|uniref:Solute carrier family 23 member 1 n=1 Tax=Mesorhabditis belari TaxID=2138241 RepID=A0AAF3EW94_9BILA
MTFVTENEPKKKERRFYKARDTPNFALCILFGFQQVMVCVSALLTIPFLLASFLCAGEDEYKLRAELIASTFVSSGISTIIQTMFGFRLALLQGTAFAYIPSIESYMKLRENKCNFGANSTVDSSLYYGHLSTIQGALILSSLVPIFIGMTGIVGKLTKLIGPITVSPLILLLVISSVNMTVTRIAQHWVSIIQVATLVATTLYLAETRVPIPGWKNGKFHWFHVTLFGQYPYLIAIMISWLFCVFLTITNLIPEGSAARVDKPTSIEVIQNSAWVAVPYPGKFGFPQFNLGLFCAFLLSAMTSVFESVGDYHAAARVSQERSPPSHAINRGIMSEGLGSFISGWLGPGVGMTTHTENIGVIGVTKVASRWTMCVAGLMLICLGLFTKVGAILSTLPEPIVGGVLGTSMAMVGGVAIANLHQVDLSLSRNMGIIGFSVMVGLVVPEYFRRFPVDTGVDLVNQVLQILLTLQMFVGAMTACILDNTVGGATREQRGLQSRGKIHEVALEDDVYSYPKPIMKLLSKLPYIEYIPFLPKEKRVKANKVTSSAQENGDFAVTIIQNDGNE